MFIMNNIIANNVLDKLDGLFFKIEHIFIKKLDNDGLFHDFDVLFEMTLDNEFHELGWVLSEVYGVLIINQ